MKSTFYGHFVAGENEEAIKPKIEKLKSYGIKCILTYSKEKDVSEEEAVKMEMS